MMRQRVDIKIDGPVFCVRGWQAHRYMLGAGLRPTYNGIRGAWVADTKRLPDLIAYLEHRRIGYTIEELGTPAEAPVSPAPATGPVGSSAQLDLFGGGDAA